MNYKLKYKKYKSKYQQLKNMLGGLDVYSVKNEECGDISGDKQNCEKDVENCYMFYKNNEDSLKNFYTCMESQMMRRNQDDDYYLKTKTRRSNPFYKSQLDLDQNVEDLSGVRDKNIFDKHKFNLRYGEYEPAEGSFERQYGIQWNNAQEGDRLARMVPTHAPRSYREQINLPRESVGSQQKMYINDHNKLRKKLPDEMLQNISSFVPDEIQSSSNPIEKF